MEGSMIVSKEKFIETAIAWFERLLLKKLPDKNQDGQLFSESEYIKETWNILLSHICHVRDAFGGHE
jgi:hypothetical protein